MARVILGNICERQNMYKIIREKRLLHPIPCPVSRVLYHGCYVDQHFSYLKFSCNFTISHHPCTNMECHFIPIYFLVDFGTKTSAIFN